MRSFATWSSGPGSSNLWGRGLWRLLFFVAALTAAPTPPQQPPPLIFASSPIYNRSPSQRRARLRLVPSLYRRFQFIPSILATCPVSIRFGCWRVFENRACAMGTSGRNSLLRFFFASSVGVVWSSQDDTTGVYCNSCLKLWYGFEGRQ